MFLLDQAGAARGRATFREAPASLSGLVEHAWIDAHPAVGPWRVVPDANPYVILSRRGDETVVALVGPRGRYVDIDVGERRLTVGLRLRIGALPALFGLGADALTDGAAPLREIAPELQGPLERLGGVDDPSMLPRLFSILARRARAARPVSPRIAEARGLRPGATPGRTLRRAFKREVGLTARQVRRIERLHRALEAILDGRGSSWAGAAHAAGFCDQPHLARDARALLGEPLTKFVARGRTIQDPAPARG